MNIAIYLLRLAYEDAYDTALILSGDGDFLPAIRMTKEIFPKKKIGLLFPPRRVRNDLKAVADYHQLIEKETIRDCRFPNSVTLKNGKTLTCPAEWL